MKGEPNSALAAMADDLDYLDGIPPRLKRIVQELVRREVQRLNPFSRRDPCIFEGDNDLSCKWGTKGCSSPHGPVPSPSNTPEKT